MDSDDAAPTLGIRPLSARSVVLSVLLGTHPPRLPISALIALGEAFGLAPGTVRTAVSRMVSAGELVPTDSGYALTGRLLERQREQDVGRTPAEWEWNGEWRVVTNLTPSRTSAERREFRTAMEGAKLGELRPDTWMRPTNLPLGCQRAGIIVTRGALDPTGSRELAQILWDLPALERRARDLLDALDDIAAQLTADPGGEGIAPGFTVLAACLRFLRVEPQLPQEVAGTGSAERLRAQYPVVEGALQQRLGELFRAARSTPRSDQ